MQALRFLVAGFLLCPALAFGTGMHPSPIVKPVTPPPTSAVPAQQAASGGHTHAFWGQWFPILLVGIFDGFVIYTHMKCVEEKRGCYEHRPE